MVFTGQVAQECESRGLDARGGDFLTGRRGGMECTANNNKQYYA
jgi:hypothetical protein